MERRETHYIAKGRLPVERPTADAFRESTIDTIGARLDYLRDASRKLKELIRAISVEEKRNGVKERASLTSEEIEAIIDAAKEVKDTGQPALQSQETWVNFERLTEEQKLGITERVAELYRKQAQRLAGEGADIKVAELYPQKSKPKIQSSTPDGFESLH